MGDMAADDTKVRWDPVVILCAVAVLVVHLVPHGAYGIFRDELYYLACARRLAWGYVDHPPLSIVLLAANRAVFGASLLALHWIPALAGAAIVWLASFLAGQLGGGAAARRLAALAMALCPLLLVICDVYSMNPFEILLWTAAISVVIRILRGGDPRLWMVVGALMGLALMNKHTSVLLGLALVVGLLVTAARRHLAQRWIWIGAAVAAAILLPNLLWISAHDGATLDFYRNAVRKNVATPPHVSLLLLAFVANLGAVPLLVAGFWFLLRSDEGRALRALGWGAATLVVLHVASGSSRPDRITGLLPLLFASGAAAMEAARRQGRKRALIPATAAGIVIGGLALLPISTAVLPPQITTRYMTIFGSLLQIERGKKASLPQWLADRAEWHEVADQIIAVAARLPAEDRARVAIYGSNYGWAGAIEHFGTGTDLPVVVSDHNNYWLWSRPHLDADVLITVGASRRELESLFESVEEADRVRCTWCLDELKNAPIFIVRRPRQPLGAVWERSKNFI